MIEKRRARVAFLPGIERDMGEARGDAAGLEVYDGYF